MWVAVRARRGVDKTDQGPGVLKGTDAGNLEAVKERWTRRRGRAVFMSGESGDELCRKVIYFQVFAVPGLAPPRIGQSASAQLIAAFPGHKYSLVPLRLPTFLLISFVSFAWAFCRLLVSIP